ncbi:hypothetical protein [Rhizobium sp. PL01]|uniref:hypothetical protein n=1 Tax=Rhizobium sp. PL01 TaxID=3085631 RepID=UPI0029815EF9|nr:hypothetical protein [Rhizobium sp. PL01]MDW5318143.1 hypothetical protein [Rhizobium sp. PL01]
MAKIVRNISIFIISVFMTYLPPIAPQSYAALLETGPVSAVLDGIKDRASSLIEEGKRTGDFLITRMGIQVKDSIDAWEKANSALLSQAFSSLDKSLQDSFRQLDSTMTQIDATVENAVAEANNITGALGQIAANTIISDNRFYVMTYTPRVLLPVGDKNVIVKVIGPNIYRSDPKVTLEGLSDPTITSSKAQELIFEIDRSTLDFPKSSTKLLKPKLQHDETVFSMWRPATWFGTTRVDAEIPIMLMPQNMGTYSMTTRILDERRDTDEFTLNLGRFQGRNGEIDRAVQVPETELGWRLDLTRRNLIRLVNGGGDHGRCEGIREPTVTENGVVMYARVDNRDNWQGRRDAWVNCSIVIPRYRVVKQEIDGPGDSGGISWKGAVLNEPQNAVSRQITIVLFDGTTDTFDGAGAMKMLTITQGAHRFVVRPRAPHDF